MPSLCCATELCYGYDGADMKTTKGILDCITIFCFQPYLKCWRCGKFLRIIRVKGWGMFLVECDCIGRMTLCFKWWEGFI